MLYMDKPITISLTKEEADYLSSMVEASATKFLTLEEQQRSAAPIKQEFEIVKRLETKLAAA